MVNLLYGIEVFEVCWINQYGIMYICYIIYI